MEPNLDLWKCEPLNARLTVAACDQNRARARKVKRGYVNQVEPCLTCPGVVALANGSGPVGAHPCMGERGKPDRRRRPRHKITKAMGSGENWRPR